MLNSRNGPTRLAFMLLLPGCIAIGCLVWWMTAPKPESRGDNPPPVASRGEPDMPEAVEETVLPGESTATGSVSDEDTSVTGRDAIHEPDLSGDWTRRRLIVKTQGGPTIVDIMVSVGSRNLADSSAELIGSVAKRLLAPSSQLTMQLVGIESMDGNVVVPSDNAGSGKPEDLLPVESLSEEPLLDAARVGSSQADERLVEDFNQVSSSGMTPTMTWEDLLNNPLVRSRWIGNLTAEDNQREQLISMYDTRRDDIVQAIELQGFLTRGLSRSSPLQIAESSSSSDESPWGPMDADENFLVDQQEFTKAEERIRSLDRDADMVVTLAEASRQADQADSSMMQSGLIQARSIVVVEELEDTFPTDASEDNAEREQWEAGQMRAFSSDGLRLLQHYTFLSEIPREQWSNYTDSRWNEIDRDASGAVDRYEIQRVVLVAPHVSLFVRLPIVGSSDSAIIHAVFSDDVVHGEVSEANVVSGQSRVQLRLQNLLVNVNLDDVFSTANRDRMKLALEAALSNPNASAALRNQLGLSEDAVQLVDGDGDKLVSAEELNQVWQWVSARQSSRLIARWSSFEPQWFLMLDANGSQQLEISSLAASIKSLMRLDADGDGRLTPIEAPLCVNLKLERADSRLAGLTSLGSPQSPPEAAVQDWFSAMDSNQDDMLSQDEFLGESEDFEGLDANKDGYIGRSEL